MLRQFLDRIWTGGSDQGDSELYAIVATEMANGLNDIGLWTKACAASDGANERAKSRYIELRVSQLREMRRENAKEDRHRRRLVETGFKKAQRDANHAHGTEERRTALIAQEQKITKQIFDAYDSPEANRRRRSCRRIAGTIVVAIAAFSYVLAFGFTLGHQTLIASAIFSPLLLVIWAVVIGCCNSGSRRRVLETQLANTRKALNNSGGRR